jgi:TIR domain
MGKKVFISYRRDDSAGHAGRVRDRLEREFGRDLLFMDVDSIGLGTDFTQVVRDEVAKCDVLLAVIGPNWIAAKNKEGSHRLDDPEDFVRIEIAAALQRNIPVVPILLDEARIPKVQELPRDLKGLTKRHALYVRHTSFQSDMDKLIQQLRDGPQAQIKEPQPVSPPRKEDLIRRDFVFVVFGTLAAVLIGIFFIFLVNQSSVGNSGSLTLVFMVGILLALIALVCILVFFTREHKPSPKSVYSVVISADKLPDLDIAQITWNSQQCFLNYSGKKKAVVPVLGRGGAFEIRLPGFLDEISHTEPVDIELVDMKGFRWQIRPFYVYQTSVSLVCLSNKTQVLAAYGDGDEQ